MKRAYHGSFSNLSFPKKGAAIKRKIQVMLKEIRDKLKERKGRVEILAKDMKMDMNIDKLSDGSYSNSGQEIKAAALRQEIAAMKAQSDEAEKLESILRNLPDNETYKLDFSELSYFGF